MNIKHNNIGKTPTNITNTGNNKIKKSESITHTIFGFQWSIIQWKSVCWWVDILYSLTYYWKTIQTRQFQETNAIQRNQKHEKIEGKVMRVSYGN